MPDSIFYDSMGCWMTQVVCFFVCLFVFFVVFSLEVVIVVFLSIEEIDSVLSL